MGISMLGSRGRNRQVKNTLALLAQSVDAEEVDERHQARSFSLSRRKSHLLHSKRK